MKASTSWPKHPKPSWSAQLLSVPIPIRKGLQGYRILLTHQDSANKVANIQNLNQLKALATGSGAQWSTTRAMQDAGFNIVTSPSYEGLFKMLSSKRFITFGRGINEIHTEYDSHKDEQPHLSIDEKLLLHIPLPTYFYVTPAKPKLQERLTVGMRRLIKNGEFNQFFLTHHCKDLIKSKPHERLIFQIPNPNIDTRSFSENPQYWLNTNDNFSELCRPCIDNPPTEENI